MRELTGAAFERGNLPAWLRPTAAFAMQPRALPLVLLLLALSTVFLFGNDRGIFYRAGHHNWNTAIYLAKAVNLSPKHNFLVFDSLTLDIDGAPSRRPYTRFPIGGTALTKLAILPFWGDLDAQIYVARVLFLLFFSGTAVLGYLAVSRLLADRWIALTATLLAFSSYYLLYYNDMLSTEVGPSLFGLMLTFHGMVFFSTGAGSFRQLLIKACTALLLGWHVYALLLPFIFLGLASEFVKGTRPPSPLALGLTGRIKRRGTALLSSRYLALGVVALLFGTALLSFNLGNEYFALDGKVALTELPTVESMTRRFGQHDAFNVKHRQALAWIPFLENQFYRIGKMTLPFLVSPFNNHSLRDARDYQSVVIGVLALAVCLVGLLFMRITNKNWMMPAVLVAAGFCWALPMRHNTAFHDFESVFYVGIPLTAFSFILLYMRKLAKSNGQFLQNCALIALLVFVLSGAEMAGVADRPSDRTAAREVMEDFQVIRGMVGGRIVSIPFGVRHSSEGMHARTIEYYLAGSIIIDSRARRKQEDFAILPHRDELPGLLTPDNRRMFLYDMAAYEEALDRIVESGKPMIHVRYGGSGFDIFMDSNRLYYVSYVPAQTSLARFAEDTPAVNVPFTVYLDPEIRRRRVKGEPWQWERGNYAGGWIKILRPDHWVPGYQYTPTDEDVGYRLRASVGYIDTDGNRSVAISDPSAPVGSAPLCISMPRFFLHIVPVDGDDLPDHRKQYGFDNFDFCWDDYNGPFSKLGVAVRELPDYDIALIRTGQYTAKGRLWEGEARLVYSPMD